MLSICGCPAFTRFQKTGFLTDLVLDGWSSGKWKKYPCLEMTAYGNGSLTFVKVAKIHSTAELSAYACPLSFDCLETARGRKSRKGKDTGHANELHLHYFFFFFFAIFFAEPSCPKARE